MSTLNFIFIQFNSYQCISLSRYLSDYISTRA
uniref:Uncharacterized protein n=1 Tax=Acinetobacter phage vB_Ab_1137_KEN_02 TaxID=3143013 RepID=A0AAU8KYE9_9VIRU